MKCVSAASYFCQTSCPVCRKEQILDMETIKVREPSGCCECVLLLLTNVSLLSLLDMETIKVRDLVKSKRDLEHTFRSGAMHASQEWELETNRVLWNNKPSSTEPHSRIARMAYGWSGVAGGWRRRQRQRRRRRGRLEGRPRDAVYTHVSSSSYDATHMYPPLI